MDSYFKLFYQYYFDGGYMIVINGSINPYDFKNLPKSIGFVSSKFLVPSELLQLTTSEENCDCCGDCNCDCDCDCCGDCDCILKLIK